MQCAQENASRSIHMICQPAPSTTAHVSKYHALGLVYDWVGLAWLCTVGVRIRGGSTRSIIYGHAQKSVTDIQANIHTNANDNTAELDASR